LATDRYAALLSSIWLAATWRTGCCFTALSRFVLFQDVEHAVSENAKTPMSIAL
jgi:hypothetical protein